MTKNRTRAPVYLDPGMHPGLEVKGLLKHIKNDNNRDPQNEGYMFAYIENVINGLISRCRFI